VPPSHDGPSVTLYLTLGLRCTTVCLSRENNKEELVIYNVQHSVVHLVEAESAEAAIAALRDSLLRAGFEPFTDEATDAFETVDQDATADSLP